MRRKVACSGNISIDVPEECRTGPGSLSRIVPLPFSPPAACFPIIRFCVYISFVSVKFHGILYNGKIQWQNIVCLEEEITHHKVSSYGASP
jgi:hypothetical protein